MEEPTRLVNKHKSIQDLEHNNKPNTDLKRNQAHQEMLAQDQVPTQSMPPTGQQNTSNNHTEAPEGHSNIEPDSISTLNQKPHQEPLNSPRMENGGNRVKPEADKKMLIWVILASILVVAMAGAGIWMAFDQMQKQDDTSQEPESPDQGEAPEEDENQLVELSLDDELVQKLYQSFTYFPGIQGFGFQSFYNLMMNGDREAQDNAKMGQILANMDHVKCLMSDDERDYDQMGFCVDANAASANFKELYGYEFINRDINDYGFCGGTHYFAEYNQYFNGTGCGGSGPAQLKRWLYKAEKDAEHVYIYDLAEIWAAEFTNDTDGEFIRNKHCHFDKEFSAVSQPESSDEDLLDIPTDVVLVEADDEQEYPDGLKKVIFTDYADKLDLIKWTFTKNSDGNYIFDKIEKVSQAQ